MPSPLLHETSSVLPQGVGAHILAASPTARVQPASCGSRCWLVVALLRFRAKGWLLDALGEKMSGKLPPRGALAVLWLHQAREGGQLSPNPRLVVLRVGGGPRHTVAVTPVLPVWHWAQALCLSWERGRAMASNPPKGLSTG